MERRIQHTGSIEPLQPAFEHRHRCKQVSECIDGLGRTYRQYLPPGIDVWNLFTWGAGENLPVYPVFCPNGEFFMPTSSDSKNGAAQIAGRGVEQNRRRNLYTTVTATGNLDALVPGLKAR